MFGVFLTFDRYSSDFAKWEKWVNITMRWRVKSGSKRKSGSGTFIIMPY